MSAGAAAPERRPRLNPFAFPSDTAFRFGLLVAAVIGANLYVWQWIATASRTSRGAAADAAGLPAISRRPEYRAVHCTSADSSPPASHRSSATRSGGCSAEPAPCCLLPRAIMLGHAALDHSAAQAAAADAGGCAGGGRRGRGARSRAGARPAAAFLESARRIRGRPRFRAPGPLHVASAEGSS